MSTVIGIDLGTSTTEAAVYRDGRPVMLLNAQGDVVTPSVVGLDDDGNWIVGKRAKAQILLNPENTVAEIKRKTGSGEVISVGGINHTPVELSAKILEYVRTFASKYLNENVTRAVISVPAYFNDSQRQETVAAGVRAGFAVERIINEPTAAALCYGLDHMDEESHILVYDLGGGTFDVTLLEMFDGVLDVKASSGDNRLGGKDFDEVLIGYMLRSFRTGAGIDLSENRRAMVRLKDEAEKCKIALSSQDSYRILLPALAMKEDRPLAMDITVGREEFEKLTGHLIERTHEPINTVLRDANILPEDIDRIILVGGSTGMPMVERDIEAFLGQKPSKAVNPDFAVAEGAAIEAAMIEGKIDPEDELLLTDVIPYTLGVRCFDGIAADRMSTVIQRNVTIPVSKSQDYYTSADYQTQAQIEVFQGGDSFVFNNHFLGEFLLGGIPPKPAGQEKVKVTFSYDVNGLLSVEASVVSTGKNASITINMHEDASGEERDISEWKKSPVAADFRALIRRAERVIRNMDPETEREFRRNLERFVKALKASILDEDERESDRNARNLEEILDYKDMRDAGRGKEFEGLL